MFSDGIGRFIVWRGSNAALSAERKEGILQRVHAYWVAGRGTRAGGQEPVKVKAKEKKSSKRRKTEDDAGGREKKKQRKKNRDAKPV